jgi:hypothetical protein
MPEVVIRVRFRCGDRTDVVCADPDADTTERVVKDVIAVLSEDAGVLVRLPHLRRGRRTGRGFRPDAAESSDAPRSDAPV